MKNKILLIIALVVFQQATIAQESKTCDSPSDDPILDFNSITKCTIEDTKDTGAKNKTVKIQVTSRKRVVRRRSAVKGGASQNAAAKKIASLKEKASLVGSLDLSNEDVLENVPFNLVEEIPLFKSCQKVSLTEQEKCFKEEVSKHVRKNFKYPQEAFEKNIQGRVYTQFVIDKNGYVANLNIRGPYDGGLLEAEAKRIVTKLPKFTPGKHHGRAVKVKYGIPITFKIPGKKASNIKPRNTLNDLLFSQATNFADVEELPLFSSCAQSKGDNALACFNNEIINHVNKNFAYPKAAIDNDIQGKIYAMFIIDKDGNVNNVKTKGPVGAEILENAAAKLFQKLPKFKPGKVGGKAVNVKHTFPIDFKLD